MIDEKRLKEIYEKINAVRYNLSEYACKDENSWRDREEKRQHLRSSFALDRDRILYSGAYRRYHGKTQVFSFSNLIDEEMTNRSLHTTYVSQISRTISKALGLNLELTEAIALGHDLGHSPFGHDGERALSKLCEAHGIGQFHHNIESLHIVDNISRKGIGLNLTFQVRDGIISHDGEVHNTILQPKTNKSQSDIDVYIQDKKNGKAAQMMPATIEGCVVRITDTIAYIGQDIEDAIRLNILKRDELPTECVQHLGNTNSKIIDNLVKSVILNSFEKPYICFDDETSHYLLQLKRFNYERIYTNENVKKANKIVNRSMQILFEKYMEDILSHKRVEYLEKYKDAEKVRDFIATMTDRYFNEEVKDYLLPWKF
jgi:dGTPase